MPQYKGLFGDRSGGEAVEPMDSYRAVLDAARPTAQRSQIAIVIVDANTGETQSTVHPDGSVKPPAGGKP